MQHIQSRFILLINIMSLTIDIVLHELNCELLCLSKGEMPDFMVLHLGLAKSADLD